MSRRVPREWSKYDYVEPRKILVGFRDIERRFAGAGIEDRVFRLRTKELRPFHERRQALLFAYGMEVTVLGTPVHVACVESEDFDCIVTFEWEGERIFVPTQLKEFAPADLNPKADLEAEIDKLKKYTSNELVVAFHLNRNARIPLHELHLPRLRIKELWFFGALAPTQDKWLLYGNALGAPRLWSYEYPT
jgi:hypothetical protein